MIFDTEGSISMNGVRPSKYTLGLEGALMHVYENECNWNSIMKSVGISELRYYKENGGDLFVNEAGALSSFASKVKAFFKKVWEKIKSIFKKFIMIINSYAINDKSFVKKYEKDLRAVNLKDFEFKGYKFNEITGSELSTAAGELSKSGKAIEEIKAISAESTYNNQDYYLFKDSDELNDEIEKTRGMIFKKGPLTESEFREEVINMLYGNDGKKEILDDKDINMVKQLEFISNTHNDIKQNI